MYSRTPKGFREKVNLAYVEAIKHRNNEYFIQEQLRSKPTTTGVFNVLQKVLLPNPDEWEKLLNEKTFKEFDEEIYKRERTFQSMIEKKLSDFHLGTNLISTIIHIREQNTLKFNEVFKKVACDAEGNLKKAILYNSSEIQPEELNRFVIQKLEQGDVFSFIKVKKVMLETPECEEEEE
jgi:hypothetical protein